MYVPEQHKFYESRHFKFVEIRVYKNIMNSKFLENKQEQCLDISNGSRNNIKLKIGEPKKRLGSKSAEQSKILETLKKRGRAQKNKPERAVYFVISENLENVKINNLGSDCAYHDSLHLMYKQLINCPWFG